MTAGLSHRETVTLPIGSTEDDGDLGEFSLRKMTGREEAMLTDSKLRTNAGKLITALLAGCASVDGKPVDQALVRRLTSADRNFLLLELRRTTFGDEMEASYHCSRCQGTTLVLEDLASIEVRGAQAGMRDGCIPVHLEDGYTDQDGSEHRDFLFALPTGEDEEAVSARRDTNPSRQRDALLARCLRQAGEIEDRRIRAMGVKLLADLSMSDRQIIRRTLDDNAPGPDLNRLVVCEHCGEEFKSNLDMSHFFPLG